MHVELIVALVLASAVLAGIAHAIGVHYAIVLVLGGLALGFVPGLPSTRVAPDVVLLLFLPPLVYAASFGSSPQDVRAHARPIGILAVGLVLATMCAVAVVIHAAAGIGWGPAMVLGAILGPTDPVAATSVLRRLGAPDRISTVLEGEALINDGTGLTVYTLAVSAVVSGHFSLVHGVGQFFAVSAGGVAIGLAVAWISSRVRRRIEEPALEISISLLTAYVAYIPAQRVGASGVLAAVAAGLYASSRAGTVLAPASRIQMLGFWEVLTFLFESVLFLLIGLQLKSIVSGLQGGVGTPLLYAGAVIGAAVVIRMAWMFAVPALVRVANLRGRGEPRQTTGELIVLGWSGMRGGVSLAAALAIPLTAGHHAFSDRSTLIFVAFVAIAVTLVVPGLTIGPLVRRLGIGEEEETARAETEARIALARAALRHIEEVAERDHLEARVVEPLRTNYELRIHRLAPHAEPEDNGRAGDAELAREARRLRRELIEIERAQLGELRRSGKLSLASLRRIERELDLEASRLAG
ncbi:MAG TPA: Na+/H+ antiporter [Solirubrobacteraceae bacterium]|nr:Na+/H+ antiporter [Solirubrobacteraceae bacterium]